MNNQQNWQFDIDYIPERKQCMFQEQQYAFYFNNYRLQCLFAQQLKEIPNFQLKVQFHKIWITIICHHDDLYQIGSEHFQFVIKVGKSFPLSGVRLYLMRSPLVPKICDTRDLLMQCLGSDWTPKHRLRDIYNQLGQLIQKLSKRSQGYLSVQKTGQFHLTQYFSLQQLSKYSNLNTFTNISNKMQQIPRLVVLGISQTHFLVFKNDKNENKLCMKQILNPNFDQRVYISRVCEIQSISNIFYYKESKEIDITFTQYKNIRLSNTSPKANSKANQNLTKRYKLIDPESLLKCILKNITKFQPLRISHTPSKYNFTDQTAQLIAKIQKIEQRLFAEGTNKSNKLPKPNEKQQKILRSQLQINYRKIIQVCSASGHFQYLIYINKMNDLYKQQMRK